MSDRARGRCMDKLVPRYRAEPDDKIPYPADKSSSAILAEMPSH